MQQKAKVGASAGAALTSRTEATGGVAAAGIWSFKHIRDGVVLDEWTEHNLIVNAGLNYTRDVTLRAQTRIDAWYVGLASSSPTIAAADTMASHGGWTEIVAYSNATRPAYSAGAGTTGQVTNSGGVASFSINGSATVGGAFLASTNDKSGTTGTLFSAVAFTGGNRSVVNGDTLEVTYNVTFSDDGV